VQDAIAGLSGLGRIVSQQVTIDDLQQNLDELTQPGRPSCEPDRADPRAARVGDRSTPRPRQCSRARSQTCARSCARCARGIASTDAEARMSTIQLDVYAELVGRVVPSSRIDRTIDEALNVLAWEGVIALGILIVAAPFALVGLAVWLGRRLYRRHEEERLLAT
jgi:hypothetical protein